MGVLGELNVCTDNLFDNKESLNLDPVQTFLLVRHRHRWHCHRHHRHHHHQRRCHRQRRRHRRHSRRRHRRPHHLWAGAIGWLLANPVGVKIAIYSDSIFCCFVVEAVVHQSTTTTTSLSWFVEGQGSLRGCHRRIALNRAIVVVDSVGSVKIHGVITATAASRCTTVFQKRHIWRWQGRCVPSQPNCHAPTLGDPRQRVARTRG